MSRFQNLLEAYLNNSISPEELTELVALTDADDSLLGEGILKDLQENSFAGTTDDSLRQRMYTAVLRQINGKKTFRLWSRVAAAAAIIATIGIGGYFFFTGRPGQLSQTGVQARFKNDVAPGSNKATLILASGTRIILDSAATGNLAQQGNTKIIKLDSGALAYEASGSAPSGEAGVGLNTISTPRGGQYQVVLADGSRVWLNSASSLKYPASFSGKERTVELTGEGYFEVAHNAKMPFRVKVHNELIEDIGTAFNINAYDDEDAIKTTLLQGSVKVTLRQAQGDKSTAVKAGEQATATNGQLTIKNDIDLDEVIAWKNGKFNFHDADLAAIMRQMARWYDVEVSYSDNIPDHYTIDVPRNVPVSQIFKFIEMSGGVHFEIEGKKIIVKK